MVCGRYPDLIEGFIKIEQVRILEKREVKTRKGEFGGTVNAKERNKTWVTETWGTVNGMQTYECMVPMSRK